MQNALITLAMSLYLFSLESENMIYHCIELAGTGHAVVITLKIRGSVAGHESRVWEVREAGPSHPERRVIGETENLCDAVELAGTFLMEFMK